MTYPDTAGFQSHSETSKEAALKVKPQSQYEKIVDYLDIHQSGLTADDLGLLMSKPNSTMSARLRELELKGSVIKTKIKRKTAQKSDAFVYVLPRYYKDHMGKATVKNEKPCDIVKLEAEHKRMKMALSIIATLYCKTLDQDYKKIVYEVRKIAKEAIGHE